MGFLGFGKSSKDWVEAPAIVADMQRMDPAQRRRGSELAVKARVAYRVQPPSGSPFVVEETSVFKASELPTRGGQVRLRFDPADPNDFEIVATTDDTYREEDERRRQLALRGARAPAIVVGKRATGAISEPVGDSWEPVPEKAREQLEVTYMVFPAAGQPFTATALQWNPVIGSFIEVGYDCLFVFDPADPAGGFGAFCSPQGRAKGQRSPVALAEQVVNGQYGIGGDPVGELPPDAWQRAGLR